VPTVTNGDLVTGGKVIEAGLDISRQILSDDADGPSERAESPRPPWRIADVRLAQVTLAAAPDHQDQASPPARSCRLPTVSSSLEERVAAAVAARRDELVRLVRQAVDEQLALLVDDEIASRVNSNGNGNNHATAATAAATTKQCARCKRLLQLAAFSKHRGVCKDCRRELDRERKTAPTTATSEPPAEEGP
jgi:hypothetical protein